jgi:hypothetical protein
MVHLMVFLNSDLCRVHYTLETDRIRQMIEEQVR